MFLVKFLDNEKYITEILNNIILNRLLVSIENA